jgi:dTDP-L-rhamnose 4-epimerase
MDGGVFNVGAGRALTVLDVAEALIEHLRGEVAPEIVHRFRAGDIHHCFADVGRIQALGYQPRVRFEDGMAELVERVRGREAVDRFGDARRKLMSRGLAV